MWADRAGDDSFTFDNLLPYFEKSVNFTGPDFQQCFTNSTLNHDPSVFDNSLKGPLQVSYANFASPLATWAQRAFLAAGIALNNGFDSGSLFGSMWSTSTINSITAHRSSSETSFLNQALQRTRLKVYPHATKANTLRRGKVCDWRPGFHV